MLISIVTSCGGNLLLHRIERGFIQKFTVSPAFPNYLGNWEKDVFTF